MNKGYLYLLNQIFFFEKNKAVVVVLLRESGDLIFSFDAITLVNC